MKRQSFPAEGELTEEKLVNVHAHSRDSRAHEATLAREPSARAEASEWEGKAPQRGENLQRKSRRMPMHIREIRRPTKRHLPMSWVLLGERRCTWLAQTLFDGKTHTPQGTDMARQR